VSGNCGLRHAILCAMNSVTEFSPAKINLLLAVTGRRADGYHDLVSVVAPVGFGDELVAESCVRGAGPQFTLSCAQPEVPLDDSNLIFKAAQAFVLATGWGGGVHFKLTKRIPLGAGLGGGSSNAVAALRALHKISGGLLTTEQLASVAATLGSDCALFINPTPSLMRGRGEQIEGVPAAARARLSGRRVLLFKPSFSINTAWAYQQMRQRATDFVPAESAEKQLAAWLAGSESAERLLANNMEGVAFDKFIALPVLLKKLQVEFGLQGRMSGSGSACFVFLSEEQASAPLLQCIRTCWGAAAFAQETRLS
jgi:4-diphosphocytidyl-2-C-methyl-D-erythritol kinase